MRVGASCRTRRSYVDRFEADVGVGHAAMRDIASGHRLRRAHGPRHFFRTASEVAGGVMHYVCSCESAGFRASVKRSGGLVGAWEASSSMESMPQRRQQTCFEAVCSWRQSQGKADYSNQRPAATGFGDPSGSGPSTCLNRSGRLLAALQAFQQGIGEHFTNIIRVVSIASTCVVVSVVACGRAARCA